MSARLTLKDAQDLARSREGECLSVEYINSLTPMRWRCKYGHEWTANFGSLKHGRWCHECSSGLYERICRKYLEDIFEEEFRKQRPKWLVNDSGNRLELDGYCEKLGIAFEHNGTQHYKPVKHFGGKDKFEKTFRNDFIKKELCDKFSVKLIIIPELFNMTKIIDLPIIVKKELIRLNIEIPNKFYDTNILDLGIYSNKIDYFNKIAENYGGCLLSDKYIDYNEKLLWKCSCGYEWEDYAYCVLNGKWCPICMSRKKFVSTLLYSLEFAKELAYKKNGECLSIEYKNSFSDLDWKCKDGHIWKAPLRRIITNHWCPECAIIKNTKNQTKYSLELANDLANKKEGFCISKEYKSLVDKLKWKCKVGHIWETTLRNVMNGSWCPECDNRVADGTRRYSLNYIKDFALNKNGKCLSDKYFSLGRKLEWECEFGHKWSASFRQILYHNTWCPECSRIKQTGRSQPYTIEDMQELAEKHNGKCLSLVYINSKTKLEWKCSENHTWFATPSDIKNGHWCPECYNARRYLNAKKRKKNKKSKSK